MTSTPEPQPRGDGAAAPAEASDAGSVAEMRARLAEVGYLADEAAALVSFLAQQLGKPILVEGPAGVGKTELAKALSRASGRRLVRLQCYEGLDEAKALYEWNYRKQLLRIQAGSGTEAGAPVEETWEDRRTTGERLADIVAEFGGSWRFIISFAVVLIVWMAFNVWAATQRVFDPYPFILLNLVLSCLAAIQAPIIMMSQKRQETKDRLRSENDYRVNLKAELEIRHLHEKIDHLINRQWERLAEIQQIQLEIMEDLAARRR